MNIEILHLIEGAKKAKGLTVVIDVFRAFSVACYAVDKGVEKIIPVGDINIAYNLKETNPNIILVGERNEQKPEGFDFGNSPSQVLNTELGGKTMVHTTSSGTQGIVNSLHTDEVITGSFVNANAIVRYIKQKQPQNVSLVCMGYATQYPVEEDTFCAEYIKDTLEGKQVDFNKLVEIIKDTSGKRFFVPEKQHYAPEEDFYLCTKLGIFDFVLKVATYNEELVQLQRIDI